ncbi:MAG: hypothetical protein M3209_14525 [Acidobacteriota bacterium]|nr:hypothetical protein [Acidobacteriota bacterium]
MGKSLTFVLIAIFVAVFAFTPFNQSSAQSDWATFWQKFKTAVAKNDKKTILSLSDSAQLPADYQALFGTAAKRKCFRTTKPEKDDEGGYNVFCGEQGYYFKKVNGQFRFTEGFAND